MCEGQRAFDTDTEVALEVLPRDLAAAWVCPSSRNISIASARWRDQPRASRTWAPRRVSRWCRSSSPGGEILRHRGHRSRAPLAADQRDERLGGTLARDLGALARAAVLDLELPLGQAPP